MRNPNRIPICLKLLSNGNILLHFLNIKSRDSIRTITDNWNLIEKTWLENPDLRFGQLLCNLRFIKNIDIENHIWNVEEDDWLVRNNYCNFEDIKFWGSLYDEHNNKRSKIKYILLKDLTDSHIEGIIKWFRNNAEEARIHKEYLRYFKKRISNE